MRKGILFLLSFLFVIFISCNNDDDNSGNGSIIGKWQLIDVRAENLNQNDDREFGGFNECILMSTIEIFDNKIKFNDYFESIVSVEGDSIINCESEMSEVTYTVEGSTLKYTNRGVEIVRDYIVNNDELLLIANLQIRNAQGEKIGQSISAFVFKRI